MWTNAAFNFNAVLLGPIFFLAWAPSLGADDWPGKFEQSSRADQGLADLVLLGFSRFMSWMNLALNPGLVNNMFVFNH